MILSMPMKLLTKSFVVQRILAAGVIFGSSLVMAKLLSPDDFGQVAFFLYVAKMLLFFRGGALAGYLYHAYTVKPTPSFLAGFFNVYTAQLLGMTLAFMLVAWLFLPPLYLWAGLAFLTLIPLHAAEPVMRVKRYFYVSLLPDVVLYSSALAVIAYAVMRGAEFHFVNIIGLSIAASGLIFMLMNRLSPMIPSLRESAEAVKPHAQLIKSGFSNYISTALIVAALFVNQAFIERFFGDEDLGIYMLSIQLCLGASLILTAQNFVAGVDIGDYVKKGGDMKDLFARQTKRAFAVSLACYGVLVLAAFLIEAFLDAGYQGILPLTAALGVGYILFFCAGSITPITFYLGRQIVLTRAVLVMLALTVVHNIVVIQLSLDWQSVAYLLSVWLTGYALFSITYTYRLVCQSKSGLST